MTDSSRKLQTVLVLAGAAGLVLPFVPFTYGVVPLTDVLLEFDLDEAIWLMALPTILLPLPILAGYATRLLGSREPIWLDKAGYVLALAAMFVFLIGAATESDYDLVWSGIILLSIVAFGGGLWSSRKPGGEAGRGDGLLAMQAAYLPPTAFWIVFAFLDDMQLGAWLAIVAVIAYGMQIISNARRRRRTLLLFVPVLALAAVVLTID